MQQTTSTKIDFSKLLDLTKLEEQLQDFADYFIPHAAEMSDVSEEQIKAEIEADPWQFVEWHARNMQRVASGASPSASQADEGDDFNPSCQKMDVDGKMLDMVNVDGAIAMLRELRDPLSVATMNHYDAALAELKVTNGSTVASQFMREQAFNVAMERSGRPIEIVEGDVAGVA